MKSLTTKFTVFIILPVALILSALSLTSYLLTRDLLIDQIKSAERNYLSAAASEISSRILQIQTTIELLSLIENIETLNDFQRRLLFVALEEHLGGSVTSVFMGFPDGKFIRSKTIDLPKDFDPRKRLWYLDALGQGPGALGGITAPYLDASTHRPTITIYRKVLGHTGELVGVVGVDVDISAASSIMNESQPLLEEGKSILANSDAIVLLHPDASKIGADVGITGEAMDIQLSRDIKDDNVHQKQYVGRRMNQSWYMGFHFATNAGVALVVSGPAKTIFEPLRQLRLKILTFDVLMITSLLVLLVIVSRKISKPIIDLKDSAIHVTQLGSYQDPLQVKTSDEVGQLTSAFNEMMEGLRQRDFIRDTFGRYVTREVVEELLDTSEGLKLGGEVREVTIMFSDLRGFTPLSEQLRPDEVISVLNSYLSRMSAIIGEHKGTINEFIGDAILTFFGAPIRYGDSPARAVACALAMQLCMDDVNRENRQKGLPPLSMGIGINTGEVIVGNIGSEERAKYGVVGHHINLASRVEGVTAGGQIFITPSTYQPISDLVICRSVHRIKFKGVEDDINLYDITGIRGEYNLMLLDQIPETAPLIKSIPVVLHKMKGKKRIEPEMTAELTHYTNPRATLKAKDKIDPLQEVRIDFAGVENETKIYLYAKVTSAILKDDHYVHAMQISYSTPMVNQFVGRFL